MKKSLLIYAIMLLLSACQTTKKDADNQSTTSSSVTPVEHQNDDLNILASAEKLFITLKNSPQSQIFYEAMNIEEIEYENHVTGRTLKTTQNPGSQVLEFTCEKILADSKTVYKCILAIEKPTSSKKAYKIHSSRQSKDILVVRNDTDYSDAAKAIFEIFPKQTLVDVTAGKDPQAGVTVIGGKGFTLPNVDSILQLQCRQDSAKYFCEFLLKNPWPKDYDVVPPAPSCKANGQDCRYDCEQVCCSKSWKNLLDPYGGYEGSVCCNPDENDCNNGHHPCREDGAFCDYSSQCCSGICPAGVCGYDPDHGHGHGGHGCGNVTFCNTANDCPTQGDQCYHGMCVMGQGALDTCNSDDDCHSHGQSGVCCYGICGYN